MLSMKRINVSILVSVGKFKSAARMKFMGMSDLDFDPCFASQSCVEKL